MKRRAPPTRAHLPEFCHGESVETDKCNQLPVPEFQDLKGCKRYTSDKVERDEWLSLLSKVVKGKGRKRRGWPLTKNQ